MADATTVTGYDPTSLRVVTMETTSSDQAMPSEHEYLADMVKLWQRKQSPAAAPPKGQGSRAATLPQVAASGSSTRRSLDGTRTAPPSPPRRQPKWRPRHTPRLSRDDYIVVLKPRAPFELKSVLPSDRAGDAIRPYLGEHSSTSFHVWPVWDQNVLVCSVTSLPMAQRLLGDIQLPVGDQQLPFRGHAKASGEVFRGVITINPAETPQRIKSELEWSQGAILAVRKLGDSTAAVVTFEGTKLPRFIFYHSVVAYVRPYKKTIPACSLCGTIGHRPSACPRPTPGRCTRCGTQVQVTLEGLAEHECNTTCLLCSGPHETGVRGCLGKYRKPTPPSTSKPPAPQSPGTRAASQPKPGSRLQTPGNPPPTTSVHYPPLVMAPPQNALFSGKSQLSLSRWQLFNCNNRNRQDPPLPPQLLNPSTLSLALALRPPRVLPPLPRLCPRRRLLNHSSSAPRRRKVASSSFPALNPASIPLPAPQGQGLGMEDDPQNFGFSSWRLHLHIHHHLNSKSSSGTPGASGTGESTRIFSSSFNLGALSLPFLPKKKAKSGAQSIHILNVYCPPHLQRVTFAELFYRALQAAARQPLVVVGDFNAPSPHGGYHYEKARGRKLKELISTLGFTLLTDPAHPTHLGNSVTCDTCPDLSLTRNIRHVTWENLEDTLDKNAANPGPSPHHGLVSFSHHAFPPAPIPAGLPGMGIICPPHTSIIHRMHLYPAIDPHLPHLWEARHSLTSRWPRYKLNRKLRSRIQALTAEAADCSAQLADTNWVDTCMKAAGQMSSKSTWLLFRSLLDPSTTRGETQRQLRRTYYAYQGPTSQLANDLCDRYLCRTVDPKGPDKASAHTKARLVSSSRLKLPAWREISCPVAFLYGLGGRAPIANCSF
ncbi:hypothetical protein HPB49_020132 [Dermacentor silvarum]|uniref:Uncharacterized protein n=1 Tax=Dermacentor silvarum TaxID=543639 RepID=A0ACB8D7S8_DERSI|nr:hypothetical protein HPB49_020132 [Dermacentor silvarum]